MNIFENRDLYADTYYDGASGYFYNTTTLRSYGTVSTFFRGTLTLLLRAGFIFVQISSIPTSNVYILLLHNLLDIALTTISFALLGYTLAFGEKGSPYIGWGTWLATVDFDMDDLVFGWCAATAASALMTTLLAGRMHIVGLVLNLFLFTGIIQPTFIHWIWKEKGVMQRFNLLGYRVSFKDHSGALIVHVCGAFTGFVGLTFLGRRLMRLKDIQENSLGPDAPSFCVVGYILIIIGLMGLSLPSKLYELKHIPGNYMGLTMVNNLLALSGGIFIVVVFHLMMHESNFNYWVILRCFQGALAGIVTISAGTDVYKPLTALGISMVGSFFSYVTAHNWFASPVEDYCNIVPIHLVCGVIGVLLPPIFGYTENLGYTQPGHVSYIHLLWQLVCTSIIITCLFITFNVIFWVLKSCGFLRNSIDEREHRRARTVLARGAVRCCYQRLFTPNEDTVMIEPGHHLRHLLRGPDRSKTISRWMQMYLHHHLQPPSKSTPSEKRHKRKTEMSGDQLGGKSSHKKLVVVQRSLSSGINLGRRRNLNAVRGSLPRSYDINNPFASTRQRQRQVFTLRTGRNVVKEWPMVDGPEFYRELDALSRTHSKSDTELSKPVRSCMDNLVYSKTESTLQFIRKHVRAKSYDHCSFTKNVLSNIQFATIALPVKLQSVCNSGDGVVEDHVLASQSDAQVQSIPWMRSRKRRLHVVKRTQKQLRVNTTFSDDEDFNKYTGMLRNLNHGADDSSILSKQLKVPELPFKESKDGIIVIKAGPDLWNDDSSASEVL